jgi:hypothetical protein
MSFVGWIVVGIFATIPSNLLKRMAGTTRLEPAASAVTGQEHSSFQRLIFSTGAAKSLQGVARISFLWVSLWVEIFEGSIQLAGELGVSKRPTPPFRSRRGFIIPGRDSGRGRTPHPGLREGKMKSISLAKFLGKRAA